METPETPEVAPEVPALSPEEAEKAALNKRLDTAAWGLFLIILGGIWLVPNDVLPEDTWLIAAGVILLGLNAIRYLKNIKVNGFTVFLGAIALVLGLGNIFGWDVPVGPIVVIIIGVSLVLGPFFKRS